MNAPASLLLFWDYDTQWGGDRSRLAGGPKDWGRLEFENTDRLLDLHEQFGIPACFAVVGAAAMPGERPYHDPAQVRRIHAAGHEVASHSLHHDWIPGLGREEVRETLRRSKEAIEDCTGAEVVSFVPPYNQPFDYPRGFSISLAERREAWRKRTGLAGLCTALAETGYRFCRVSYSPLSQRIAGRITKTQKTAPAAMEMIRGVHCIRMNAPGGFNAHAHRVLDFCAAHGGIVVVGGHPHSLHAGNTQDETMLVPFLRHARELVLEGKLVASLPRHLIAEARP